MKQTPAGVPLQPSITFNNMKSTSYQRQKEIYKPELRDYSMVSKSSKDICLQGRQIQIGQRNEMAKFRLRRYDNTKTTSQTSAKMSSELCLVLLRNIKRTQFGFSFAQRGLTLCTVGRHTTAADASVILLCMLGLTGTGGVP